MEYLEEILSRHEVKDKVDGVVVDEGVLEFNEELGDLCLLLHHCADPLLILKVVDSLLFVDSLLWYFL